ncbi:alpha-L-fucosidase-like protein [Dyadobacter jejuensis]|uniref:Alpha-L-fucosidase-like protein n=2 Tax=Dyadobacter jejuensis TaxID=1082580 RepID=A0A316AJM9_9BACT|nr:alpha-L-fucosidase-like protein [Dyadobacter jejuensis]
MLVEVVSKNGVMLLSAGPMPDGTIPTEQVEALHGIGAWLKKYGEAVYGTRPFVSFGEGPTRLTVDTSDEWNEYGAVKKGLDLLNFKDIRYTQKGRVIYCTQLGWNDQVTSILLTTFGDKAKKFKVQKVSMLGSSEKITWTRQADGLKINLPKKKPELGEMATVFKIEVE